MTRIEALQARVHMPQGGVPQLLTGLTLAIHYAQRPVERDSVASSLYGLTEECAAVVPLFAAGFAGAGPAPDFAIMVNQAGPAEVRIDVTGAAHDSRLLFLMLRLIEAGHQTPPGAWQRLLDSMDGDETEARAVFNHRSLEQDVLGIAVVTLGLGAVRPFDLGMPEEIVGLSALANAIAREMPETDQLVFNLPTLISDAAMLEHGFLTLQNAGVFSPLNAAPERLGPRPGEPEIMLEPAGQSCVVTVMDWTDAPIFLAEYLRVLAVGQAESVALITSEDAD